MLCGVAPTRIQFGAIHCATIGKINGVEFGLGALPLAASVSFQEDSVSKASRLDSLSRWQRAAVFGVGPVTDLSLAALLLMFTRKYRHREPDGFAAHWSGACLDVAKTSLRGVAKTPLILGMLLVASSGRLLLGLSAACGVLFLWQLLVGVCNFLPIPPTDGYKCFRTLLTGETLEQMFDLSAVKAGRVTGSVMVVQITSLFTLIFLAFAGVGVIMAERAVWRNFKKVRVS